MIFVFVVISGILYGCGGGGGSELRKDGSGSKYEKNQQPIIERKSTREFVFPRTKTRAEGPVCPTTQPESWTDEWFKTCQKIEAEKKRIRERDSRENAVKLCPDLSRSEFEFIPGDDNSDKYKLRRIHRASSVTVFVGKSWNKPSYIFKYELNCSRILKNELCDSQWGKAPENVAPRCHIQLSEDPLLDEYIITKIISESSPSDGLCPSVNALSPPVALSGDTVYLKTDFRILENKFEECLIAHSSIRLLVEERVGKDLNTCIMKNRLSLLGGFELINFATTMFIRLIQLIKRIHALGIIHGDIHDGNIAFPVSGGKDGCLFNSPEKIMFIDFGYSEFFPFQMNQIELGGSDLYSDFNARLLSPFELAGSRRGRRDDVYRVFEIFIDVLTKSNLSILYSSIESSTPLKYKRDAISIVKSALQITAKDMDENRFDQIFIHKHRGVFEVLRPLINYYNGLEALGPSMGHQRDQIFEILKTMEAYVKNQIPDRPLSHPDSEPDYDWLISEAEQILRLVPKKQ